MIFGKKSDLKTHLSTKRPTWTHKVVAHSPLEENLEMERLEMKNQDQSRPDRDPPPGSERLEPIQPRY